ncbi:hypothetical protein [Streptomyces sp. NPDC007088]|uniref:hypothetical protein n=1 Tax=Streptomyces sp. NPDC007088 TaxID=3364773 RepID=UPI0036967454
MDAELMAATRTVERLSERVYLGLRQGHPAPRDVVELACVLLDWGHPGEAVREAVERDPARVSVAETDGLARRILEESGFEPGFDLAPERLTVLREALGVLARDLPTAGVTGEPRLVLLEDFWPVSAGVELADGRVLAGDGGLRPEAGVSFAAEVAAVAALVQEDLMKRTWRVWPVCGEHGTGLHADTREDVAVWWCAGARGHVAAPVGELGLGTRQGRRPARG